MAALRLDNVKYRNTGLLFLILRRNFYMVTINCDNMSNNHKPCPLHG